MNTGVDDYTIRLYMILALLSILSHFLMNRQRNYFRIDLLFLFGFVIVHFQWPLMIVVSGVELEQFYRYNFYADYITYGTWLSLMGLHFWILGYSFIQKEVAKETSEKLFFKLKEKPVFNWTKLLFVLFLITAGKTYLSGEIYSNVDKSSGDPIQGIAGYIHTILMIFALVLSVILIVNFTKTTDKLGRGFLKSNQQFLLLVFAMIMVFFLAGDRSSGLILICGFLVVYSSVIQPISQGRLVILGLGGALVMNVILIFRSMGLSGLSSFGLASLYDLTLNLANSARTLYIGLYDYDVSQNLYYGKLWVGNLLGAVPFAQGVYAGITGTPEHLMNTSKYITYLTHGEDATTGEGTSLIIDIFLNFGLFGVVVTMLLFGLLASKLQFELDRKSDFRWLIAAAIIGSVAFYISRASIFNPVKALLWSYLIGMYSSTRLSNQDDDQQTQDQILSH